MRPKTLAITINIFCQQFSFFKTVLAKLQTILPFWCFKSQNVTDYQYQIQCHQSIEWSSFSKMSPLKGISISGANLPLQF